jgi:hypothetical protein
MANLETSHRIALRLTAPAERVRQQGATMPEPRGKTTPARLKFSIASQAARLSLAYQSWATLDLRKPPEPML